jgi:hypothetical protein
LGWQKFIYPLLDTNITEVMNRVIEAIMLPWSQFYLQLESPGKFYCR